MKNFPPLLLALAAVTTTTPAMASKLVTAGILDKDMLMLYYRDGDVVFDERDLPEYPIYTTNGDKSRLINKLVTHGAPLDVNNAAVASAWKITSANDANFGAAGVAPTSVHRKSKLGCMAQMGWDMAANDYHYDWAYEHWIFLKLPKSLQEKKTYTLQIPQNINSDAATQTLVFDIFNSRSEAVKVNIVGYSTANSVKAADVYAWLGDGGARDYSSFVGNKIFIHNVATKQSREVGTLSLWKPAGGELRHNHQMLRSAVWKADFTGFNTPGKYRLAVEGIGCSDDFIISPDVWREPFKTSVRGFFYMRVGEDNLNIKPVPRRPLYIPGKSPAGCKVFITDLHPWHEGWPKSGGDPWDNTTMWEAFCKPGKPTNPNAWGGHSDALDWDRQLGHVGIIYDMLLPYIITNGALSEDNLNITESGNKIPDIIDEARYEVDFFLRLRDGEGYSHGLNNPNSNGDFYQAGCTPLAAWANAANAAMLSEAFRIAKNTALMNRYRDEAITAYNYAAKQPDMMLDKKQGVGEVPMTGKDFRITAAAFLYNVTGDTRFEDDLAALSACKSPASLVVKQDVGCELYAYAGYIFTPRKINHPVLHANMQASIIAEAKKEEANFSQTRPSRRSTDNSTGWYITVIDTQRSILAHAVSKKGGADQKFFEDALILEADFSLGRNPMNMIHMTTSAADLGHKRGMENAYTSGWNDGTPGCHPGHTPYMNIHDWGGLIMGRPSWMTQNNFPPVGDWPYGELYYNTRYVYCANEFTPQQTMKGKTALYGYLHAISKTR